MERFAVPRSMVPRTGVKGIIDRIFGGNRLPLMSAWLICSLVVFLCLVIFILTFIADFPLESKVGLGNYFRVFDRFLLSKVIPNTVAVGFGTVTVVFFFGVPLAWLLNRTNVPWRSLWIAMLAVTIIIPSFLKTMGWLLLINPRIGLINKFFMGLLGVGEIPLAINNVWGIAFIQGLSLTPTMFFLLSGPMRSLNPLLEEAAEMAGASRWKTLLKVSLPVVWPAILGGAIYTFMTAIAIFDVAGLLGGFNKNPVLSTMLYVSVSPVGEELIPSFGVAGVYGLLIAAPSLVGLYYYFNLIQKGYQYEVVVGKAYRPKTIDLGRFKYVGLAFILVYLLLSVFLPFLVLVWQSLLPYLRFPSAEALSLITFEYYADIVNIIGVDAIRNTVLLTTVASVAVLFFSFMVSWIVVRTRLPGRRAMDIIAMLPHAIPGLAFAFALLILGILGRKWVPWLPLYGTIWVIVIAHIANRLSFATRLTNAALLQVGHELEEAAYLCGATNTVTMRRVLVPLVRSSITFAGLWTGLLIFRDVSIALLLDSPDNHVLAVQIWHAWGAGNEGPAAAMGVVMVLVMTVMLVVIQWLGLGRLDRPV